MRARYGQAWKIPDVEKARSGRSRRDLSFPTLPNDHVEMRGSVAQVVMSNEPHKMNELMLNIEGGVNK